MTRMTVNNRPVEYLLDPGTPLLWALRDASNLTDRLGVGAGLIYQGEQFASFSGNVTLPDYVRVDAAVFYTVLDRLAVQVNVENLFDEQYYPSAHGDNNIQPGRPFTARLGFRLTL